MAIDELWCSANSCRYASVCNEQQECQIALRRTARQCGYDFSLPPKLPETPVTDEMTRDGLAASPVVALRDYEVAAIYRAMATVAPNPRHVPYEDHDQLVSQLLAVQRENADLRDKLARMAEANVRDADDKNACIARLRAQLAAMQIVTTRPTAAQQTASDISSAAEPARRPDGTLAPQPKPWAPPKQSGDARRIGG